MRGGHERHDNAERGECAAQVADLVDQGEGQARRASELICRMRDFAAKRPVELCVEAVSDLIRTNRTLIEDTLLDAVRAS